MSFFQNIGKKVGEAAHGVKSKADEIAAIAKLNKAIADENKKIATTYAEMGKKVYDLFVVNGETDDVFEAGCKTIAMAYESIKSLNEQILETKNVKSCPNCGTEVTRDVMFCPKCGHKYEKVQEAAPAQQASAKVCPNCHAESPADTVFCTSCGTKLD